MVVIARRAVLTLLIGFVMTIVGAIRGVPGDALWVDLPGPFAPMLQGLASTVVTAYAHPKVSLVLVALVVVPILIGRLSALVPRKVTKDPQRMYTTAQRHQGFQRSENRCEMEDFFYFRCKRPAEHGDHWLPWSKGGATDMANFVSGCAKCNIAKSNKVPTFWETQRLAYRRRSYFPPTIEPTPGHLYARR